jgi:C1A family cysteine protease
MNMKTIMISIVLSFSLLFSQDPLLETSFETDPFSEGWTLVTQGGGWIRLSKQTDPFAANTGLYGMAHLDDTGTQNDWLISPVITLPNDSSVLFSYWESSLFSEFIGSHEVCVTLDGGSSWTRISSTVPEEAEFKKVVISLAGFIGKNIRIGWHYEGDYSDRWYIDDVRIVYDNQAPVVTNLWGDPMALPFIGTYTGNELKLTVELYDRSEIVIVEGVYSFDEGKSFETSKFVVSQSRFVWTGAIPAKSEPADGIIRFRMRDIYGNEAFSGDYSFSILYDDLEPEIISVTGLINLIGNDAEIKVKLKDHSGISSITGYYSSDGFLSFNEFDLMSQKDIFFNYSGTIPSELTANDSCGVYLILEDGNGNKTTSGIYDMKWINSYSELKKFDLRTDLGKNYVSHVKNQPNGTCWMYSACASMESNLMMTGNWAAAGEEGYPDLSEQHMSWWFGFNEFYNADADPVTGDGLELHLQGSYYLNAAYMMRGEGAVRQKDADSFYQPPERFSEHYNVYYPRNVEWFTMDAELNGINVIKQKIVEHGALSIGLKHTAYDPNTFIHYQSPDDPTYLSHGVSVCGWDDDFVTQAPEGPGAWLCKNSWGADFGYDGFYWVSYYDKHAGRGDGAAASFQNVERMKYDDVYYHDYHGYSSVLPGINEAFNAFSVREKGKLSAVSFFNSVNDVDYTVKIYSDFISGKLTGLLSEISGHIDYKGYHTIDLVDEPLLNQGNTFYIYLDLSDGGQPIDQTSYVQVAYLWYTSKASPGESYYFEGGEWKDLYYNSGISRPGTANFCIKGLFNRDSTDIDEAVPQSNELYQNYPNPFNPSTTISYSIRKNSKVSLNIYNMNGQLVKNLINKTQQAGRYSVEFYSEKLSSGLYFYRLETDGTVVSTKKMLLVR